VPVRRGAFVAPDIRNASGTREISQGADFEGVGEGLGMDIRFVGHAGFVVETEGAIVVADPWLSREGAFASGWMQFPQNHQLAPLVREKLSDPSKERFVYVSHEHEDHFDRAFLASLPRRDFTAVVPRFRRRELVEAMRALGCKAVVACADGDKVPIPGGYLRLFVQDGGLNRDSGLLVKAEGRAFLNLNDCKIHDRLAQISAEEGPIDVFAAQFSGAIWHPTCYEYPAKTYAAISRRKMFGKFEAVARALEAVRPRTFLASAGPACFLDPDLIHLNFEEVNIFPRAQKLFTYLGKRLKGVSTELVEPMPGDVLDAGSGRFSVLAKERVGEAQFEQYVRLYADRMQDLYGGGDLTDPAQLATAFARLREELELKLSHLELRDRVAIPLYVSLRELPQRMLRVDFPGRRIEETAAIREEQRYTFQLRAVDALRVLDRKMTWEELFLSFRVRLSRVPDEYDPVLHGFLALEAKDLGSLCDSIREVEANRERAIVDTGRAMYSVHRYCPHQGADMTEGWIEGGNVLVCPRHRWHFDLDKNGRCTLNNSSLCAERLPPNVEAMPKTVHKLDERAPDLVALNTAS
jgi:UDP-MurNAc hydroxylase